MNHKPTQSKAFWALCIIYAIALLAVYADLKFRFPDLPKSTPDCVKPEPRNPKAIDTYLTGCIK